MSQTRGKLPHSNGDILHHYISKSTEALNGYHDPRTATAYGVANLLQLIDSVVDCQEDTSASRLFANASLSHIPRVNRTRYRSNSTILTSKTCNKLKARNPPRISRRSRVRHILHVPPSPASRESQSSTSDIIDPRSYSSSVDAAHTREEQKYPSHSSSAPDLPKISHRLSAILSVGNLEFDTDADIDNEYCLKHDHESSPTNEHSATDTRTKNECKRIMFLYNSKSGGQKAVTLLRYFRSYTSLIYDLLELNSSKEELHNLAHDLRLYEHKIVVCIVGGDGSQCWGTSLIDAALQTVSAPQQAISYPTVVPFPVGTGNDLSRSLGWGNMERTPDKIIKHLADVQYCYNISKRFSVLDRWSINYTFENEENIDPQLTPKSNHRNSHSDSIQSTFSPPLPKHFMCYLSFGYDARITYNFARERKMFPQRFKSQLSNQAVYLKFGLKELMKPSMPVNDSILLEIDGKNVHLPKDTRSLKLVNINSAANGVFFWGYLKSNKEELQTWKRPQLNDGLIEIMASRGSADLCSAKMRMGHAHRLGQSNDIKLKVVKTPVYLQIDGEGWCIEDPCVLHIELHDQLPTLIGYKEPRGVYHKYEADYYTDEEKEARHRYRDVLRIKYNIPKHYGKNNNEIIKTATADVNIAKVKTMASVDDFNLKLGLHETDTKMDANDDEHENNVAKGEETGIGILAKQRNKGHYRSMSELQSVKVLKKEKASSPSWKPLFANKNSWKRNLTEIGEMNSDKKQNKKDKKQQTQTRKVIKWF